MLLPGSLALPGSSGINALLGLEVSPPSQCSAEGDDLGCLEEQSEAEDEDMAEAVRTELLQREVQMVVRKSPKIRRRSLKKEEALATANNRTGMAQVQWKFKERGEGSVALEQEDSQADGFVARAAADRRAESATSESGSVDCFKYPMFCHPKLNCARAPLTDADKAGLQLRLATLDGHTNIRSWCMGYPMYATSVQKCIVEGDPAGYAKEMFSSQSQLKLLDADAAYCFAVGHCNNTALGPRSTLQEAEVDCDRHFGHARWTSVGWKDMEKVMNVAFAYEEGALPTKEITWAEKLLLIRNLSTTSAITACAMGNFHCDVTYCQENFCQNAGFRARFANLSWA